MPPLPWSVADSVADRDFGELIFNQGLAHTGVLFFRLPGAQLQTKIEHHGSGTAAAR
jgi:hypothetical protein